MLAATIGALRAIEAVGAAACTRARQRVVYYASTLASIEHVYYLDPCAEADYGPPWWAPIGGL